MKARDYRSAIANFRRAAIVMPKHAEPYYQLGCAYLANDLRNEALAALTKAVQLDSRHTQAQLKLAELKNATGVEQYVQESEQMLRKILDRSPGNADALSLLAASRLRLGESKDADAEKYRSEAEKYLTQALEQQPQHLRSAALLAGLKLNEGDLPAAESILRKLVDQNPSRPESVLALGNYYLMARKNTEAEAAFRRALQLDPNSGPAMLQLGRLELQTGRNQDAEATFKRLSSLNIKEYELEYPLCLVNTGKLDAAIGELERLRKKDPADRGIRSRLIAAYARARRFDDAHKLLASALKSNPKDIDALLDRATLSLAHGQTQAAREDLNRVLQFKPEAQAHYLLARIHRSNGEPLRERQELNEAVRLNPALLQARIELAGMLLTSRSFSAALHLLDQAPEHQKQTPALLVLRNWALILSSERVQARKAVDETLARLNSPEVLVQDGILKWRDRNLSGARSSLETALKLDPENQLGLEVLVQTYVSEKKTAAATARLRQMAAQQPRAAGLQRFFGDWLIRQGELKEARAVLLAAKASKPNNPAADISLTKVDISERKFDDARRRLSGLLASNPSGEVRLMLAGVEQEAGNYAAAIEHYRKVVEADMSNVPALNNLAGLMTDHANQLDQALQYAQRAAELAPSNPFVQDTLGWVYYRKGLYPAAVQYLESAVKGLQIPLVKYHLAMAYLRTGDRQRGEKLLETALKADPTLPEAKLAADVLRQVKTAAAKSAK